MTNLLKSDLTAANAPRLAGWQPPRLRDCVWHLIGAFAVLSLIMVSRCVAECDSCLAALATHAVRFDSILLQDSSGAIIRGELLAIDKSHSLLSLAERRSHQVREFGVSRDKVIALGYRKAGKPNFYLAIAGFFLGQIVGKIAEDVIDPSYDIRMEIVPFQRPKGNEDGTWIGAIAGFGSGLILPMLFASDHLIACTTNQPTRQK